MKKMNKESENDFGSERREHYPELVWKDQKAEEPPKKSNCCYDFAMPEICGANSPNEAGNLRSVKIPRKLAEGWA
ncbi:unnamed protein product [Toxocara canis]|uniref:Uncharacterized protein n=1 Tax=Toxocara canis TaxID=6265 RepID=A0A183U9A3_TOXCA|nr:unnamed protein product [Toxocara canis]